jgi:hypothetical protein
MHDERALSRRQAGGAIATEPPTNPWAEVGLLKPHQAGAVVARPRVDAIATISAGFKQEGRDGRFYPVVSRDGTIHVSAPPGQAQGLRAALAARDHKSLTIAFLSNDPAEILQQRFALYSATRLEAYGDAESITVIHLRDTGRKDRNGKPVTEPVRETVRRAEHPDRYAALAATMSAQSSLYFGLAEWGEDGRPRLVFPDGWGYYRLRFTSLNSAEAIRGALYHLASLTGGLVAGVPLELSIAYQDVAGPDGSRRNVPVWSLRLNPPGTIKLEASRVREILEFGLEQARTLALPAPRPETLEYAQEEGPDVDLDAARVIDGEVVTPSVRDVERLAGGGPIRDPRRFCQDFMLAVKGTSLVEKANRQQFMIAATSGRYDSLKTFAESATHREATELMAAAARWINEEISARAEAPEPRPLTDEEERLVERYHALFGEDEDVTPDPPPAVSRAPAAVPPEVHKAAVLTGAPVAAAEPARFELPGEPDWLRSDELPLMLAAWQEWLRALEHLDPVYAGELPKRPRALSSAKLVTTLRGMVGYARERYADIYGDPEDDVEPTGEPTLVDAF